MQSMFKSAPVLGSIVGFLLIYALVIVMLYRPDKEGRRRRWLPMDYIWVPLGALTGIILIAFYWRMHATM
jgi:hypothetical protein